MGNWSLPSKSSSKYLEFPYNQRSNTHPPKFLKRNGNTVRSKTRYPATAARVAALLSRLRRRWLRVLFIQQKMSYFQASKNSSLLASLIPKYYIQIKHGIGITMLFIVFWNSHLVRLYDCFKLAYNGPKTSIFSSFFCSRHFFCL